MSNDGKGPRSPGPGLFDNTPSRVPHGLNGHPAPLHALGGPRGEPPRQGPPLSGGEPRRPSSQVPPSRSAPSPSSRPSPPPPAQPPPATPPPMTAREGRGDVVRSMPPEARAAIEELRNDTSAASLDPELELAAGFTHFDTT